MRKKFSLLLFAAASTVFVVINGCEKDYVAPQAPVSKSFIEEFDTVANLYVKGWVFNNNSRPQGAATWQQGNGGVPAYSYTAAADEYLLAYYESGAGRATLSSWALTPEIEMKNGDRFSFYTLAFDGRFPDRLQIRTSTENSIDVGFTESSVGKYTTLLADINANLTATGYPGKWTKFEYTITGLTTPAKRRIAFRYYVPNGGPSGTNSYAIGIDKFEFVSQ